MAVKTCLKIVTKGNASTSLVNAIHKDMLFNNNIYFNKVVVRAKSITVSLTMSMEHDKANALERKYQSWYDAELSKKEQ